MLQKFAIVFALLSCISSSAMGDIWTTLYLADANMPLVSSDPNVTFMYRDIMVGTRLTILVSSDRAGLWSGRLEITGTDTDCGVLSARDYNDVTHIWEGSILEAAGGFSLALPFKDFNQAGVRMMAGFTAVAGDWFVVDYGAMNVGNCTVCFYEVIPEECDICDPFNAPPTYDILVQEIVFSHVPSRDFIRDTKVDFLDFAVLASYWGATDCGEPDWCQGTDIDTDGDVDRDDLMLFADYWLESTE